MKTILDVAKEMLAKAEKLPFGSNVFGNNFEVSERRMETMCSSFFRHCAITALGEKKFLEIFGNKEPNAATIFQAVKTGKCESVKKGSDIRTGDFISIRYDELSAKGFSGHTAIIHEIKAADTRSYMAWVIDSTSTAHGKNGSDRRATHSVGGIGAGWMLILHDEENNVCGYSWSREISSTKMYNEKGQSILIGRI